ncbi:MAG: DUF1360 domain-containing protein [Actinomycetota bacterium]|nr:DUF1360 domain-containing protein [Actinomycetota bacterium]
MSTATVESGPTEKLRAHLAEEQAAYAHGEDRPLASFGAVIAIYSAVVGALAFVVRRSGRPLPAKVGIGDVALISVATHKLSRLFSKDPITSPLRAPFTRFEGTSGEAELAEEVRGKGARRAMGELLTCPFCVSQWVATGLVFGLVLAPRATRLFATLFTSLTAADLLQFGYDKVQQEVTG